MYLIYTPPMWEWEGKKWMLPKDVAELKNVSISTVYAHLRDGRLPARKLADMKVYLITEKAAAAWEPAARGGAGRGQGRKPRRLEASE